MNPVFPDMKALQATAGGKAPSGKATPEGTPEDAALSGGRGEGRGARTPAFGDLVEPGAGERDLRGKAPKGGDTPDAPLARLDRGAAMRGLSAPLQGGSEPATLRGGAVDPAVDAPKRPAIATVSPIPQSQTEAVSEKGGQGGSDTVEQAAQEIAALPVVAKPDRPVPVAGEISQPAMPSDGPRSEQASADVATLPAEPKPVEPAPSDRSMADRPGDAELSSEMPLARTARPVVEPASGVRTAALERVAGPAPEGGRPVPPRRSDDGADPVLRDTPAPREGAAATVDTPLPGVEDGNDASSSAPRSMASDPASVDDGQLPRAKADVRGEDGPAPAQRPSTDAPVRTSDPVIDADVQHTDRPAKESVVDIPRQGGAKSADVAPVTEATPRTVPTNVQADPAAVEISASPASNATVAGTDAPSTSNAATVVPATATAAIATDATVTPTSAIPLATAPPRTSAPPESRSAEERPARIRDTAPVDAATIPRSSYASPDRYTARSTAPRGEAPAPRVASREADPYSIAATMNEPTTSAEAAQTLAAATVTPTPAVQATASITVTPTGAMAMAAQMAMPVPVEDAASKAPPGGFADGMGESPVGLVSRGVDGGTDVRQAAPSLRPTTAEGADALQEIVRAAIVTKGPTTIELRLDPSELGKIDIELSFVDDRVSIMVRGERDDALDLMRRSSDELGRMLRQAGLDLDTLGFSRDQAGERGREQAFRTMALDMPGDGSGEGPGDIQDTAYSATRSGVARDRVDIRI